MTNRRFRLLSARYGLGARRWHMTFFVGWWQFFGSEDIGGEEDQQPNYVDINPLKDYGAT